MKSPLQHRVFRRPFTAQVIALAGTGLSSVALVLLAYDLAGGHAGFVLGTALALQWFSRLRGSYSDTPRRGAIGQPSS